MESYKHSGKFPIFSPLLSFALGLAGAAIFGIVYCYYITWIPLVFLSVIGTAFFGFGIGFCTGFGAMLGHIRNGMLVAFLTFICTTIGIYIEWAFHPFALGEKGFNGPIWSPAEISQWANTLFQNGSWSLGGGGNITGWLLVVFWFLEWAIIYVCALFGSAIMIAEPYCEECNAWTERKEAIAKFQHPGVRSTSMEKVAQGDVSALFELTPINHEIGDRLIVDTNMCPKCMETAFLSLREITIEPSKGKGEPEEHEETIWTQMVVDKEDVARAVAAGVSLALHDDEPDAANTTVDMDDVEMEALRRIQSEEDNRS